LLALLDSPNIIKFVERVESSNYIYIITELCNGGDLDNLLD
jgi:serine/threonine protein kinase